MSKTIFFVIAICWNISLIQAQFGFEFSDSIPVEIGNDQLKFPWSGGINHAQFSTIDYDFDGLNDLFIFDRSGNQIMLFKTIEENGDYTYKYIHNAASLFPEDLRYRVQLIDYNGDDKVDLFTYGIGGIKVYKNTGNLIDGLQWEVVKEVLKSEMPNGSFSNLFVSSVDIPALYDVDGDGDLDILTFNIGGQRIEYHKNTSVENYASTDSLIFKLENECWGKFIESDVSNSIDLNSNFGPCANNGLNIPEVTPRHSGSTVLAINLNNDNYLDLILGDVSHRNITALFNDTLHANPNAVMDSLDINFPSNTTPVDIPIFPANFYLDVNHDSIKDLIVTTNASGSSENKESVWYYKNNGTNEVPNFVFSEKGFLQNQMIENGKGALPVLVDLNNDGLKDLLIGTYFQYLDPADKISKIQCYLNTGTSSEPKFKFITDDWLSLSNSGYALRMHPTFGDLNNNAKQEMILGRADGLLSLYKKTGPGIQDYSLEEITLKDYMGEVIDVGQYASPQLFDITNNGRLDLVIGKKTAGLVYYENIGTKNQYSFKWVTDDLGAIDMGNIYQTDNYSTPHFVRHEDSLHLFVGNQIGNIHYFSNLDQDIIDDNPFVAASKNFANINTGGFSSPFVSQLTDDGRYHLFVGTDLGGLWAFVADKDSEPALKLTKQDTAEKQILVFPNPSKNGIINIKTPALKKLQLKVLNSLGQVIITKELNQPLNKIDLSTYRNGVYTLLFISDSGDFTSKKVIIK
ncbi:hypothetical protein CW751_07405 [Brumimicrobium salinarum]|uniref:Secretion system C-terminal sorting domain-containing protein n=1 Tax=Brumimicrobium salinarum TaxID=2058658 RepID=A0A2I0R332_9FLAO|nr:T9SS type A sorting domain-containing protein [Brumimicrobium salinarum]PKR80984.1 hypothetical protein CW751_07405 [Brumimicrobium salinarum]